jgi:hypothetical protein
MKSPLSGSSVEQDSAADVACGFAHFAVTASGPVKDSTGTHVHTALVDQNTGEAWRMECSSSTGVHFARVAVITKSSLQIKSEHGT